MNESKKNDLVFFLLLQKESVQNLFFLGGYDSRFFFKSIVHRPKKSSQAKFTWLSM